MDILKLAKDFGLPVLFALLFWMQLTAVQDSMQKQLDAKSAQDSQREARMASHIDALESMIQGKLQETIDAQNLVLRDATNAIRENTTVIVGLKAMLPKQP